MREVLRASEIPVGRRTSTRSMLGSLGMPSSSPSRRMPPDIAQCGNTETASRAKTAACRPAIVSLTERIVQWRPAAPSASSAR